MHNIFGGGTCQKVALQFEGHLQDLIIFSICSDERLPDGLEEHLQSEKRPLHLLIVGDFMALPPPTDESPASYEAIKLILTNSEVKQINVGWVNGADIGPNLYQNMKWHAFHLPQNIPDEKKDISLINDINFLCSGEREAYLHVCNLLNFPVYVRVKNDKIVTIDLTDNQLYPRGLTNNLSNKQMLELWRIVSQLRYLKKINACFNALSFLPDFSYFTQLEKLDLRGNPHLDLYELHTAKSLSSLNISACSLSELPSSINSLPNLKSLLAYKNHITDISNIRFPKSIERISLYRNQISNKTLELGHCDKLQEVNLGANPILNMTLVTSPHLRTLQLRARYTKSSIIIAASENTTFYIRED
ncbi:leucine-rich repeat domain-containing protein [Colwellia ponticola]|uniref:Leucine-rich repeat domain-containing protein n=1 Tax=Colwellia ponticola TaxID=2304625 RepID=A0A8H2JLU6_9GAMM|nr:leucine-rich repeat domain-containing protein [Colwellia ponticola]TMM45382.1 leucine-rich repeat domain-containing protein [Colwellia ponticola]